MTRSDAPVLVYDGDCAYCCYSVRYWQRLTGDRVRYVPLKQAVKEFPELDPDACRKAIHWLDGEQRLIGARAAAAVLARQPGGSVLSFLIRHVPGVAPVAQWVYAWIARHRELAARVSRLAWGRERYPDTYARTLWVFERALGLIYLMAFLSLGVQISGLLGAQGILPVAEYLESIARIVEAPQRYWLVPTALWLGASDGALHATWAIGAVAAVAVISNRGSLPALLICYSSYLSLQSVGQQFLSFQWDLLLLEVGFLSLWTRLAPRLCITLFRWLLFRFIFLSGVVKLVSGDASWASLTALEFHFETQPLPTPLAWYAHQLPDGVLSALVVLVFIVELILPFFFFAPRRLRLLAAAGVIAFELCIVATGNYNFFNLLTLALCVCLADDRVFDRLHRTLQPPRWRWPGRLIVGPLAAAILIIGSAHIWMTFAQRLPPQPLLDIMRAVSPLQAVNSYGVFAVMTTTRPEITIQGSADGETWKDYVFRYKPGPPDRGLPVIAPHQPRLDWQMWFAALSNRYRAGWFEPLMIRLLHNSPAVTNLLDVNPFPDSPPTFVRALIADYRFSTPAEREQTGQIWQVGPSRLYYPVSRLPESN